jgi:hypothetical protein
MKQRTDLVRVGKGKLILLDTTLLPENKYRIMYNILTAPTLIHQIAPKTRSIKYICTANRSLQVISKESSTLKQCNES